MIVSDRSLAVVKLGVEEFNAGAECEDKLELDSDSTLFGRDGQLDSMGLVHLLAIIEENAEDEFDIPVTLADERALGQERNPFRSILTLSEYLASLVEDESGG